MNTLRMEFHQGLTLGNQYYLKKNKEQYWDQISVDKFK